LENRRLICSEEGLLGIFDIGAGLFAHGEFDEEEGDENHGNGFENGIDYVDS